MQKKLLGKPCVNKFHIKIGECAGKQSVKKTVSDKIIVLRSKDYAEHAILKKESHNSKHNNNGDATHNTSAQVVQMLPKRFLLRL